MCMVCDGEGLPFPEQTSNNQAHKRVLHTLKLRSPNHLKVNIQAFYIGDINPGRSFSFDSSSVV